MCVCYKCVSVCVCISVSVLSVSVCYKCVYHLVSPAEQARCVCVCVCITWCLQRNMLGVCVYL